MARCHARCQESSMVRWKGHCVCSHTALGSGLCCWASMPSSGKNCGKDICWSNAEPSSCLRGLLSESCLSFGCTFWTVQLPDAWARLGRHWWKEGWLFLCPAVAALYLVGETGCANTKSSISFQATHLELWTERHPLQQQLVPLLLTAQTHGTFRKERRRRGCPHAGAHSEALTFIMCTGILTWQPTNCFYGAALHNTAWCQLMIHKSLIIFKNQTWKMSIVYIREERQAVPWITILCTLTALKLITHLLK